MTGVPERPVGGLSVRTPAGVELQPIGRDDFEVTLGMLRELYGIPVWDADEQRRRYDRHVNSVDSASFMALAEREPAGVVIFQFRRRLNHATYEGWVSDLFVRPAARRRGIGRALMQATREEWKLRGGHRLTLETGHDNAEARALYASVGLTDAGKMYQQRPISPPGPGDTAGVEIRPIGADDFDAVTRLLAELGRPVPTEESLPALERTYRDHLRRSDIGSLIAFADGSPAGFLSLEYREPFSMAAPQAWIPDLIVAEWARGRGIGQALLHAGFTDAVARGAYGVVLESGHQREVAHRLYERSGMLDVGSFFVLDRS